MNRSILAILAILLAACSSEKKTNEQAFLDSLDSETIEKSAASEAAIAEILQQIPNPLEIAVLLKKSGKKYNSEYLKDQLTQSHGIPHDVRPRNSQEN